MSITEELNVIIIKTYKGLICVSIGAHVLQDEIAVGVTITTGVLVGPFNSKDRA